MRRAWLDLCAVNRDSRSRRIRPRRHPATSLTHSLVPYHPRVALAARLIFGIESHFRVRSENHKHIHLPLGNKQTHLYRDATPIGRLQHRKAAHYFQERLVGARVTKQGLWSAFSGWSAFSSGRLLAVVAVVVVVVVVLLSLLLSLFILSFDSLQS